MKILRLDHYVLTVKSIKATCEWYSRVLNMRQVDFGPGKTALHFGSQKINLHLHGQEPLPKAGAPTPGSSDVCLVTDSPIEAAKAHVENQGVEVLLGPVKRTGAVGPMESIYFRDPDHNLVEVSSYGADAAGGA